MVKAGLSLLCCPVADPPMAGGLKPLAPVTVNISVKAPVVAVAAAKESVSKSNLSWQMSVLT